MLLAGRPTSRCSVCPAGVPVSIRPQQSWRTRWGWLPPSWCNECSLSYSMDNLRTWYCVYFIQHCNSNCTCCPSSWLQWTSGNSTNMRIWTVKSQVDSSTQFTGGYDGRYWVGNGAQQSAATVPCGSVRGSLKIYGAGSQHYNIVISPQCPNRTCAGWCAFTVWGTARAWRRLQG